MDDPADDSELLAHLKELGEEEVRLRLSQRSLPLTYHSVAVRWIAELDRESERAKEASQAEQIEIARSAKDAAWAAARAALRAATNAERANTIAIVALIIAAISVIVTITGVWIVHRNAAAESVVAPAAHKAL